MKKYLHVWNVLYRVLHLRIDIIKHKIRKDHFLLDCKDIHLHEFGLDAHKFKMHIFTVILKKRWCGGEISKSSLLQLG